MPSLDQIWGPWSHSMSRNLWAQMQHFMSLSMSQMAISYHCSIRESCLRKRYTTNQKTRHIPVKPRLYCLSCKLSSQIETAKNRCYNYASQMSIRSLVQIVQWQKKNKQTNISHTDKSDKLVICNMQFLLLYFYTWLENGHFWDTEQVCSERKQPQWIYKWRVYCKIWMMFKKFKTLWWQDGLFSTTRFANSTEIFLLKNYLCLFILDCRKCIRWINIHCNL